MFGLLSRESDLRRTQFYLIFSRPFHLNVHKLGLVMHSLLSLKPLPKFQLDEMTTSLGMSF